MIRVKIKVATVYWAESPCASCSRHDMHGIGLAKHDAELKTKIARILRTAPKKRHRAVRWYRGGIVHDKIFPLQGVVGYWW